MKKEPSTDSFVDFSKQKIFTYPFPANCVLICRRKSNLSSKQSVVWCGLVKANAICFILSFVIKIPSSRNERQEAEVLATGCESHMFAAMLPFSWIVYETIESIIHAPQAGSADDYGGKSRNCLSCFRFLLFSVTCIINS